MRTLNARGNARNERWASGAKPVLCRRGEIFGLRLLQSWHVLLRVSPFLELSLERRKPSDGIVDDWRSGGS